MQGLAYIHSCGKPAFWKVGTKPPEYGSTFWVSELVDRDGLPLSLSSAPKCGSCGQELSGIKRSTNFADTPDDLPLGTDKWI